MENLAKKLIAIITPLSLITSVSYLFAFWFTFNINIFEYLQISELIVFSIMPFVASTVLLGAYGLYASLLYPLMLKVAEKRSRESNWFRRMKWWAIGLFCILAILFMFYIMVAIPLGTGPLEFIEKWEYDNLYFYYTLLLLAPLSAASISMIKLGEKDFGKRLIDNETIRRAVLFLVIFLPLEAAAYGKVSADMLKSKSDYFYVKSDNFPKNLNLKKAEHMRYVGKASNYFFFLMPDKETIVIIKDSQILPFKLQRHYVK